MQATTRHGIAYADGNDVQRLNDITALMATSIDNAIENAHRFTAASVTALPASGTPGLVAGKSLCWTAAERLLWIWTGSAWIVAGGAMPFVSLSGGSVIAENNPVAKAIPWVQDYLAPSPSSMWSSGDPSNVLAPVDGIYMVDVVTRWPDTANVEVSLRRENAGIGNGPRQYALRNGVFSAAVQLYRSQRVSVWCSSYSGNQALAGSSSKLTVSLLRSL